MTDTEKDVKKDPDVNVEDTGKLITKTGSKVRGKLIGLIALALVVVAVIAFFGLRNNSEKRYEEQIRLAEAAFAEGDYERAEEYYLAAIAMNDRDVRAREGLAYTKSLLGKHDEALELYKELLEMTGDEDRYGPAIKDEEEGETTRDPDLMIGAEYEIVKGEVNDTMQAELEDFLMYLSYYINAEASGTDDMYCYDHRNAADFGILNSLLYNMARHGFLDQYPGADYSWNAGASDPQGIASGSYMEDGFEIDWEGYSAADVETVNWIARNIFNASDEEIAREVEIASALNRLDGGRLPLYMKDGYYYQAVTPLWKGDLERSVTIQDVRADGEYFDVTYIYEEYFGGGDLLWRMTIRAKLQYKIIDGKGYWSLYTLDTEKVEP